MKYTKKEIFLNILNLLKKKKDFFLNTYNININKYII